jgi:hypothetical protein
LFDHSLDSIPAIREWPQSIVDAETAPEELPLISARHQSLAKPLFKRSTSMGSPVAVKLQ